MFSKLPEASIHEGSPLKSESLRLQTRFGPAEVTVLEAAINHQNINEILHAIIADLGDDTIRFLVVAIDEPTRGGGDDFNNIHWHIIAWGGAIDHIQVVNGLRTIDPNGNFASVLGLAGEQRVTQDNIVLAGYIEDGYSSEGNQPSLRFSSTTLEAACYPINDESWKHRFMENFPNVKIMEAFNL